MCTNAFQRFWSPAIHTKLWVASTKNSKPVILYAVAILLPAFCCDLDIFVVPDRCSKWKKTLFCSHAKLFHLRRGGEFLCPVANTQPVIQSKCYLWQTGFCSSTGTRSLGETGRNFLKVKLWLQQGRYQILQAGNQSPCCYSEQYELVHLSLTVVKKKIKKKTHQHNYKEQLSRKQATIYRLQFPAKTNPLTVWFHRPC